MVLVVLLIAALVVAIVAVVRWNEDSKTSTNVRSAGSAAAAVTTLS